MPYYLYKTRAEKIDQQYLIDRLTLLDKCDKLLWFTNTVDFENEVDCLDVLSATELYYWFKYKNPEDIYIIDWKDAGVPKYTNKENWALTTTEVEEITNINTKDVTFRKLIQEYEKQIKDEFNIFKGDLLGKDECNFIKSDMNAFLFGLISDQSVKAELAWSLPYRLKQRLGHFDIHQIAEMQITDLERVIKDKPALHRYPSNIAKYLIFASQTLINNYNGDASNIWANGVSAEEIVKRLEEFKGISHKKAALGSLLLVRDLGVEIVDKENINLAYDIHIRRICLRTGLITQDSLKNVIAAGKKIFPEFPGRLTSAFWAIGRDICRPSDPMCTRCPLDSVCDHNIYLGGDIHA
ncbi:MAG: endonuclease III [Clostridia bacterium]|nr:endonuclease III [Clostridia bacterium]